MVEISEIPVTHFTIRENDTFNAIVLHDSGALSAAEVLAKAKTAYASYHYVIDSNGAVYRCVEDTGMAFHSPFSTFHGFDNVNEYSIGIMLITDGDPNYTEPQMDSLMEISMKLCREHFIPLNRVVGTSHVRTMDEENPRGFPWFEFLNTLGCAVIDEVLTGDG